MSGSAKGEFVSETAWTFGGRVQLPEAAWGGEGERLPSGGGNLVHLI